MTNPKSILGAHPQGARGGPSKLIGKEKLFDSNFEGPPGGGPPKWTLDSSSGGQIRSNWVKFGLNDKTFCTVDGNDWNHNYRDRLAIGYNYYRCKVQLNNNTAQELTRQTIKQS